MNKATRIFASTFGAFMALAGVEHGIGEALQGRSAPSSIMIQSWPDAPFFRFVSGEPAMTIMPNLLVAGILTILVSLALLVWAILFVQRKNGGLVMILISLALLLAGGGIFPPILLMITGIVATRIHSPLNWWTTHLSPATRHTLANLWPWFFTACFITWPGALLGPGLLGYYFGVNNPALIMMILFLALGFLLVTVFTGFAYDIRGQVGSSSGRSDLQII